MMKSHSKPASPRFRDVAKVVVELTNEMTRVLDTHSKTCLNCAKFDEVTELCADANQRPPARVIAFGCPNHNEDVPF